MPMNFIMTIIGYTDHCNGNCSDIPNSIVSQLSLLELARKHLSLQNSLA